MSSISAKLSNLVRPSNKPAKRPRVGYARHRPHSIGAEVLSNHHHDSEILQPAKPDFIPDTLDKDLTPFVQGVYWQVALVAHREVAWDLKEKEAIDQLVKSVVPEPSEAQGASGGSERAVSIKVTTLKVRVKDQVSQQVEYEFPVSRLCYCGTDAGHKQLFTFVTKEEGGAGGEGRAHHGYVFRCHSPEKARTLALCVAKAYHLAFRVWRQERGLVTDHPDRESIFEPYPSNEEEIQKARTPELLRKKLDEFLGSNSSGDEPELPQPKPKPRVDRRPSVLQSEHGEEMSAAFLEVVVNKRPGLLPMNMDADEVLRLTIGALSKHSDPGSLENLLQ